MDLAIGGADYLYALIGALNGPGFPPHFANISIESQR
jgi:hypothetical protein